MNSLNRKHKRFVLLIVFFIVGMFLSPLGVASGAQERVPEVNTLSFDLKDSGFPDADFKNYRQNIDDLFGIAIAANADSPGGIHDVIINLNRKLSGKPDDFDTLVNLGHLYRIIHLPKDANLFYERALVIQPDNFLLNCFSAIVLFQMQDYRKALERLNLAIKIYPKDANAWLARGRTLLRLNMLDEAMLSLKRVLDLDPENEVVRNLLSYLYLEKGEYETALKTLESSSLKYSGDQSQRYRLGYLYLLNGNADKSIKIFEELLSENVRDKAFLYQLSIAYYVQKDYEKARNILEHYKFMDPKNFAAWFLLALVYRETNRLEDAISLFQAFLNENPDHLNAYIELALTFGKAGRVEEGIKVAEEGKRRILKMKQIMKERKASLDELDNLLKKLKSNKGGQNNGVTEIG